MPIKILHSKILNFKQNGGQQTTMAPAALTNLLGNTPLPSASTQQQILSQLLSQAQNPLTASQIQQIIQNVINSQTAASIPTNVPGTQNPIVYGMLGNLASIGLLSLFLDWLPKIQKQDTPKLESTKDLIDFIKNFNYNTVTKEQAQKVYSHSLELLKGGEFDVSKMPEMKFLVDYLYRLCPTQEQRETALTNLNKLIKFKLILLLTKAKNAPMIDVDGTWAFKSLEISNNSCFFTADEAILEKQIEQVVSRYIENVTEKMKGEAGLSPLDIGRQIFGKDYKFPVPVPAGKDAKQTLDYEFAILRAEFILKNFYDPETKITGINGEVHSIKKVYWDWFENLNKHVRSMDEAINDREGTTAWYRFLVKQWNRAASTFNTARYGLQTNLVQAALPPDRTISNESVRVLASLEGISEVMGITGASEKSNIGNLIKCAGIGGVIWEQPAFDSDEAAVVLWDKDVLQIAKDVKKYVKETGLNDFLLSRDPKTLELKGPSEYVFQMYEELQELINKGEGKEGHSAFCHLPKDYLNGIQDAFGACTITLDRAKAIVAKRKFPKVDPSKVTFEQVANEPEIKQALRDVKQNLLAKTTVLDKTFLNHDDEVKITFISKNKNTDKIPVSKGFRDTLESLSFDSIKDYYKLARETTSAIPMSFVLHPIGPDFQGHTNKEFAILPVYESIISTLVELNKLEMNPKDKEALSDIAYNCLLKVPSGFPEETGLLFNKHSKVKKEVDGAETEEEARALINVWFNGLQDEPLVTYAEFVMGKKLNKAAGMLFENFFDYYTSMYGDSASDTVAILRCLLRPDAYSAQTRFITTRDNVKDKCDSAFIIENIRKEYGEWEKIHQSNINNIYKDEPDIAQRLGNELKTRIENQLKACPIMASLDKDTNKVTIIGEGVLNGKTFNNVKEYKDFIFQEGGWYDLMFDPRIIHMTEVDHNVRSNMIASVIAGNIDLDAVQELIKNPELLLKETAPYRKTFALGAHHSFADVAEGWDNHLSESNKPLYSRENYFRLRLPIITQRVIAGSAIAGAISAITTAGIYLYKYITKQDLPSHQPPLMGERKTWFNEFDPTLNSDEITKAKKLKEEENTKVKDDQKISLINRILNLAHETIISSYFGLNLGWLIKNIWGTSQRQPAGILGNLLGLGLIAVPPTDPAIQRAAILSSISLNMLGWFNNYIFGGQLDVKLPLKPTEFLEKLQSNENIPSKDKPYNKLQGKPYFAAVQYAEIFKIGKDFEINAINKGCPRWLAVTASNFVKMGAAVKKTLDPKFAHDMLFTFWPEREVTRGNIVNKDGGIKTMPHGVGFALAWGAFLPMVALVIGGVADVIKAVNNKSSEEQTKQDLLNNPSSDPLMLATALSATIPGIATASISPIVAVAAQGEPLTGSYIGVSGSSYNAMPKLNSNLMAWGGIGSSIFSLLSLAPGHLGHMFSALYDASALGASLGNANNDMIRLKSAYDAAIVQGSLTPLSVSEHYNEIAAAEIKGTDTMYPDFPRLEGIYGEKHVNELSRHLTGVK